jgi:hypothetical protein
MKLRVFWKLILRRFKLIAGFCKECGVDVQDFVAPEAVWKQVEPHLNRGSVLCYNCFSLKCKELSLPSVYKMEPQP